MINQSRDRTMRPVSVLCLLPRYFFRPKNTDWRHGLFLQRSFSRYGSALGVEFSLRNSLAGVASMNWRHLQGAIAHRLPSPLRPEPVDYRVTMFDSDCAESADALYAYGCFPDVVKAPVVWHTGETDVELLRRRGVPMSVINRELDQKRDCVGASAVVAVSSPSAQKAFEQQFPESVGKTSVLPFVLPGVTGLSRDELERKHLSDEIRVVFVGREARRKGLDLLLDAFVQARRKIPQLRLTVVSSMADGPLPLPPEVMHVAELDYASVQALMRSAHIFAMPSREESYGLVYVEAFAAGAVVIAPDREPQRTLLRQGECGCLVQLEVPQIAEVLVTLSEDRALRRRLANKALDDFNARYAESEVMAEYAKVFRAAAGQRAQPAERGGL